MLFAVEPFLVKLVNNQKPRRGTVPQRWTMQHVFVASSELGGHSTDWGLCIQQCPFVERPAFSRQDYRWYLVAAHFDQQRGHHGRSASSGLWVSNLGGGDAPFVSVQKLIWCKITRRPKVWSRDVLERQGVFGGDIRIYADLPNMPTNPPRKPTTCTVMAS